MENNHYNDYSPNLNQYNNKRIQSLPLNHNSPTNTSNNEYNILLNQAINDLRLRKLEMANCHQNKKKKKVEEKLSEFLKSQEGSRIYQRKLKKITKEEIDGLLTQLDGKFADILVNVYSNYFCQKLFSITSTQQKRYILENVNIG